MDGLTLPLFLGNQGSADAKRFPARTAPVLPPWHARDNWSFPPVIVVNGRSDILTSGGYPSCNVHHRVSGTSMFEVRRVVKRMGESVLVKAGAGHLGRLLRRDEALILAYHNVVPDQLVGRGDASLHLGLSMFRRQLDLIVRACRPVSIIDLLSGAWKDRQRRLAVAITFDDAYRGTVSLGVPELAKRGIPATLFVAPAILGDRTLWWDAFADAGRRGLSEQLRTRILEEGRGTHEGAVSVGASWGMEWRDMPDLMRTVTEEELRGLRGNPEITVGSHTWRHPSLVTLSEQELSEEFGRSQAWLKERFGDVYVNAVSYPYGHSSSRVEEACRSAGFAGGLDLRGGLMERANAGDRFRMARNNVPQDLSLEGLSLRLAGWW